MAGIQGPCPRCRQEIIAPDNASGLATRIPTPEPPPPVPETAEKHEDDDVERREIEAPATPPPVSTTPGASAPSSPTKRRSRFLPVLLTAIVCLSVGYFIGTQSVCTMSLAPSPPPPVPSAAPSIPAESPTPATPANSEPEPEPTPEPDPEPVKVSAAAEAALRAFLEAPDWASRAAHVLTPEAVRPAMEAYSQKVPDGPTPYKSISVQNSYTDRDTGNTLFIFKVVTEAHPTGVPVAVAETDTGWLVDWQAFVEFRDDLFKTFAEGPVDKTGRFHLLVSTPPPPRAANTENKHFSSFLLEPPFPDSQRLAYVRKTAGIHAIITEATSNGAVFTPVLEVTKLKTPDGKTYLEITGIVAHDWLPEGR